MHTHTHTHSIHSMDINRTVVYTICAYVSFVSKTHILMARTEQCEDCTPISKTLQSTQYGGLIC